MKLLQFFGSLQNVCATVGKAGVPNVRCSPQLGAFILANTAY